MAAIKSTINANGVEIRVNTTNETDYISLTDIAKKKEMPKTLVILSKTGCVIEVLFHFSDYGKN